MEVIGEEGSFIYFKQNACRRTIFYKDRKYFVSIPTLIFSARFFKKSIDFLDLDMLYGFVYLDGRFFNIPLKNIFLTGSICLPNVYSTKYYNINDFIEDIGKNFWMSSFKDCSFSSVHKMYEERGYSISDLNLWEKQTKMDKKWIPAPDDLIEFNVKNNGDCVFGTLPSKEFLKCI